MKIQILATLLIPTIIGIYSCAPQEDLEGKKAKLASLREEAVKIQGEIGALEKEIIELDTNFLASQRNYTLVSIGQANKGKFIHKVDVRGTVASKNNILVSSKVMGSIMSIKKENGESVREGDIVMTIDATILQNNIAEVQAQLELAITLFEKQKALWDQEIGTEVQYLQAKTNKETLEKRLSTLRAQLKDYYIKAPADGQVNNLDMKIGETVAMGTPVFRVVGTSQMYIQASVSERYIGKFKIGDSVDIEFPSTNESTSSTISAIGRVINDENRTFVVEVDIPENVNLARANQVAVATLTDYSNDKAITVPTKIIQFDNLGNFIFVAEKAENSLVAEKKYVTTGKSFRGKTEIVSGLTGKEQIILEGYRDVSKGTFLKSSDLAKS